METKIDITMTEHQLIIIREALRLLWVDGRSEQMTKDVENLGLKISTFLDKIERISKDGKSNDGNKRDGKDRKVNRIYGMGSKRSNDTNK